MTDQTISADDLDGAAVFQGVGLAARRELLAVAVRRELQPSEVLIEQGQSNAHMFLLLEGELGVHLDTVDGEPVAVVPAGDTVGELSLLDGSVASAFVVAREPCSLLELSEDAFWQLTNASHAFALNLLVRLAGRLRANNTTVSHNVRKRRQYELAAMFDSLTGIHNRRWLDDTLSRIVRRIGDEDAELSLSLLDIDHFKSFNDTYGHDAGDHVLTVVASTLASNLRPTDLVARFGGEEFVIVFPETSAEHAVLAADRIRRAVAAVALVMPNGQPLPSVTISMGVAQFRQGMDVAGLVKRADAAMYRAKQAGRDRVCSAEAAESGD